MICCIDSNTFIWGIKGQADPDQLEMIDRAQYLFEMLDAAKHQVMIPTIVLAEVLAPEPLEKYPVLMDKISKGFMICDFDLKSAARYGQIFMNRIEELKRVAKENEIDNQKMKVDHLIIACALANNAGCIYSTDRGIRTFGTQHIEVRPLPTIPPGQTNLFGEMVK